MPHAASSDALYLARTLELALRGGADVLPNPQVGCVMVGPDGQVLAEGYHRRYGGPHAEVEAARALPGGVLPPGSTVYVSLEPCAHHGKTPPCADLLVRLQPAQVVAATTDPNPLVAGQGFTRLRAAGIQVQEGPLKREALALNRRFVTRFWAHRPFITLKWAQTADGLLARADYTSQWITGPAARRLAHRARAQHQAIAVGYRTALHDNPSLDTRLWPGPSPVRVVVDPRRALPPNLKLFTDGGPTLHLYEGDEDSQLPPHLPAPTGYRAWPVNPLFHSGWAPALLNLLSRMGLHSLLVEGGARLLQTFLQAGLWDEALVFAAPVRFGPGGIPAPALPPAAPLATGPAGPDTWALYPNLAAGFWPHLERQAPGSPLPTLYL